MGTQAFPPSIEEHLLFHQSKKGKVSVRMAAAAATAAIDVGMQALGSISEYYYENEAMMAWWNDWESRDQRARIERTFNTGRFSHQHRTLGIPNGRWYCCMKQSAHLAKGNRLD